MTKQSPVNVKPFSTSVTCETAMVTNVSTIDCRNEGNG